MSTLIRGGTVVNHDHSQRADVLIDGGKIVAIAPKLEAPAGADFEALRSLVLGVCLELAQKIAADGEGAKRSRDFLEPRATRGEADQEPIVINAKHSDHGPEEKINWKIHHRAGGDIRHTEVESHAENPTLNDCRGHGRGGCKHEANGRHFSQNLFENKQRSSHRSIECRSDSRASSCGNERLPSPFEIFKKPADFFADHSSHLHQRAFASQDQAGREREEAAKKFHG